MIMELKTKKKRSLKIIMSDRNNEDEQLRPISQEERENYFKKKKNREHHNFPQSPYYLAVDEKNQKLLRILHSVHRCYLDGSLWVPTMKLNDLNVTDPRIGKTLIKGPKSILDLGCGDGQWLIEMSDEFPMAQCRGVDLVPIQPSEIPHQVTFEIDDINEGLPFPPNSFDFVHCRHLCDGVKNYLKMINEIARSLRGGGKCCFIENKLITLYSGPPAPNTEKLKQLYKESIPRAGVEILTSVESIPDLVRSCDSLEDVRSLEILQEFGESSDQLDLRRIAEQWRNMTQEWFRSQKDAFFALGYLSNAQLEKLFEAAEGEWNDPQREWKVPVVYVWATKKGKAEWEGQFSSPK